MFAYSLIDDLPSGNRTVWSQQPLQPLAAGPLTQFSYSVLEEVLRRAWYQYFDELGFDPMPRARILRQHNGIPYLNLTLSAQRDAEHAGTEPITLLIDTQKFPVAKWEKSGFLAGIRQGRNRKKIMTTLAAYQDALPTVKQKAKSWCGKTKELRWTQADVLQIMEEIERVGVDSLKIYFAARHNLEIVYNRLLWLLNEQESVPKRISLIGHALGELTDLVEFQIAEKFLALGLRMAQSEETVAWLATGDFPEWRATMPDKQFVSAVQDFLDSYGHRAVNEAEIRNLRWEADFELIFKILQAIATKHPKPPTAVPSNQYKQRLIEAANGDARTINELLEQARLCMQLQSDALHAFAYILTGTREWAQAAAGEALADERLTTRDDVFFFTLEEIKQMMTGEWNISDKEGIQQTCAERRASFASWEQQMEEATAPELLIGDATAKAAHAGLPVAGTEVIGPLRHWNIHKPMQCDGAVIGAPWIDSGWALLLPLARALVVAQGTPIDPIMAAARAWHLPTVTALGTDYYALTEGAQTTVQGETGHVEQ